MIKSIEVWRGDITKLEVDAIVNAANESLLGGGGVDGAIHAAAGAELLEECKKHNGCKTGKAIITKGYNFPAKYIIHTVGPIYSKKNILQSRESLRDCYTNSLILADQNNITSIAFPAISTGAFGYPKEHAIEEAILTLRRYLVLNETAKTSSIKKVILVAFTEEDEKLFKSKLPSWFLDPLGQQRRFVSTKDNN